MSPEQRAELLRQAVLDFGQDVQDCSWFDGIEDGVMALIATAIRQAENAAYERAYREIALTTIANIEGGSLDFINGLELAGKRIRSLKSQEP